MALGLILIEILYRLPVSTIGSVQSKATPPITKYIITGIRLPILVTQNRSNELSEVTKLLHIDQTKIVKLTSQLK